MQGKKMENLKTYIDELKMQIDEVTMEEEAVELSNKFDEISSVLHVYRAMIPANAPHDLVAALDDDLEHYGGVAALACKRAEDTIKEIAVQAEDDAEYGTYEEQVRDIYYRGAL